VLELEVPEHGADVFQMSCARFVVTEDLPRDDVHASNSIKVDTSGDVLNALAGNVVEWLASQVPEWSRHIGESARARCGEDPRPRARPRVTHEDREWFYGGPDNDACTRHRLYRDDGTEKFVFNGDFAFVAERPSDRETPGVEGET